LGFTEIFAIAFLLFYSPHIHTHIFASPINAVRANYVPLLPKIRNRKNTTTNYVSFLTDAF